MLLDALQNLETEEIVSETASDLASFGLSEPKVAVTVVAEGAAKPFEFELGDSVPAGSGLFARVPGQPRLFTVSSTLENTLTKSAFDLRDRGVLKVKKDAIQFVRGAGQGQGQLQAGPGSQGRGGLEGGSAGVHPSGPLVGGQPSRPDREPQDGKHRERRGETPGPREVWPRRGREAGGAWPRRGEIGHPGDRQEDGRREVLRPRRFVEPGGGSSPPPCPTIWTRGSRICGPPAFSTSRPMRSRASR